MEEKNLDAMSKDWFDPDNFSEFIHANQYSALAPSEVVINEEELDPEHQPSGNKRPLISSLLGDFDMNAVLGLFDVMEEVAEEYASPGDRFLELVGLDSSFLENLADIFGQFGKQHERTVFHSNPLDPPKTLPRKIFKFDISTGGGVHIYPIDDKVFMKSSKGISQIGNIRKGKKFEKVWIPKGDWLRKAGELGDVTTIKGTCLGYSSIVHSACIMAINQNVGLVETIEGYDLNAHGVTWEVTGWNWNLRKSSADVILNKYAIMSSVSCLTNLDQTILEWSQYEDSYNSSMFVGTSLETELSPYTACVERLHNIDLHLTTKEYRAFYEFYRDRLSREQPKRSPKFEEKLDPSCLSAILRKHSKRDCLPSPLRVLAGKPIDPIIATSLSILPQISATSTKTTYHNFEVKEDPVPYFFHTPRYKITDPIGFPGSYTSAVYEQLLDNSLIQQIYIESELMSKINGSQGCFWSRHSNVGIAWKKTRAKSLTYYVCYYVSGKPERQCGIWARVDSQHDIWRGPTFKHSIQQIQYATCLIHRFYALTTLLPTYLPKRMFKQVYASCIYIFSMYAHSTWQTSSIAADFRFIVTCSISESGDIQSMIDKIPGKITNFLSFPDSMVIRTLIGMCSKSVRDRSRKTPLLGMPLRMMALEKDLTQGMCWHMREANHATKCMVKIADNIRKEAEQREEAIRAVNEQIEFLEKLFKDGVDQKDFNNMMDKMPSFPHYNHIVFSGLAWKSAEKLHAGKRQRPTPIQLKGLVTDHNGTLISVEDGKHVINSCKVAEGFVKTMRMYENPKSVHELVAKMSKGPKVEQMYAMHPKDSRDKDREIPQMSNLMRALQFMSESLITIYTDAEPTDMMQKKAKFPTFVREFTEILKPEKVGLNLKSNGKSRSEDKKSFCHFMHPEFMSLATQAIAKVTHTASLTTAAALQRVDRVRYCVLPLEADHSVYDGIEGIKEVTVIKQGKRYTSIAAPLYRNMQQGVRALGAALVNTAFSTGLDELSREIIPDIIKSAVVTTSDDSARGAKANPNSQYDTQAILEDYLNLPLTELRHAMMMDSAAKAIESHRIAEFNNFATSPSGAYPQCFPHAMLCIQPLVGDTLIDDIMTCTNNSRMTITWGDSIDLARGAFHGHIIMLMQKWLITPKQLNLLIDKGLFPTNDEELIAGFSIRNDQTMKYLISRLPEERLELVRRGEATIAGVLRDFRLSAIDKKGANKTKRKPTLVYYSEGNSSIRRNLTLINAARRVQGRKQAKLIRPYGPSIRAKVKNAFFECINEIPSRIIENYKDYVPPDFQISIHTSPPVSSDKMPCIQGEAINVGKQYNLKSILAKRYFDLNVSQLLDADERAVVEMKEKEFEEWYIKHSRSLRYMGYKHSAPGGRPLVRTHNNVWYIRPRTMGFSVSLPNPIDFLQQLTVESKQHDNVRTCIYGGKSLKRAKKKKCNLAFGYSVTSREIIFFYQRRGERSKRAAFEITNASYKIVSFRNYKVYVQLKPDYTPIPVGHYGIHECPPVRNYMVGDPTARLNYGSWPMTSASSACSLARTIFSTFGSNVPYTFDSKKPRFPHFPENVVSFPRAEYNVLNGSKSSRFLNLTWSNDMAPSSMVDLHGRLPQIVYEDPLEYTTSEEE